jgi:hypothetical protein
MAIVGLASALSAVPLATGNLEFWWSTAANTRAVPDRHVL